MALRRVRRRGRSSITSLIDVIFLLLLFFMLASTFTRFSEVDIAPASASDMAGTTDQTFHRLSVSQSTLYLGGDVATFAIIEKKLSLEPGIVEVTVTPDTTTQRLVDVVVRLSGVPGAKVRVAPAS
ncbi:MAG: biopolymer transporter ExbD [Pseudomonadota bacterium]